MGNTPVKGGTAVWAEPPSSPPTYIFPYMNSANISNLNLFDFQYLMYRPLYWFGQNGQPVVNPSLSLASPPTVSGRTLTISLKHYMWSNGTQVTAQDVMFWLNMELAEPDDYGAYTGFPTNVTNIKAVSPTELTMTMDQSYSPTWFLYNELSQVTPMPAAWDRTAGPEQLRDQGQRLRRRVQLPGRPAKDRASYASSPLWSIVDGPWKLSAFNADGHVTFVPNKSYSGPVKPKLAEFQEVPFTTDTAEYDVLQSPSSSHQDRLRLPAGPGRAGQAGRRGGWRQPAAGYTLAPLYPWGIDYYAMNFQSTVSDHAAIFKQLYFRQAMAYLMHQSAIVRARCAVMGRSPSGPVAATPVTKWLSAKGRQGDPFPYNPAKAKSLLTSHGWTVIPNGTDQLHRPGQVRPGDHQGQHAELQLYLRIRGRLGRVGDDRSCSPTRHRSASS